MQIVAYLKQSLSHDSTMQYHETHAETSKQWYLNLRWTSRESRYHNICTCKQTLQFCTYIRIIAFSPRDAKPAQCTVYMLWYRIRSSVYVTVNRGAVVRERGGTPFRQIFWSRNGAPVNIVGHIWNANTEAFQQITSYSLGWPSISLFSGPNCPQTRDLASKIS